MSATIDQQFVEYIIKSIVSNPDDVIINRTVDEKGVLLELTVNDEDLGRVIGKRGATAQSIRTLLRAFGTKNEARYNLKIIDNGPRGPVSRQRDDSSTNDNASAVADNEDSSLDSEGDNYGLSADSSSGKKSDSVDPQDKVEDDTSSSISRTRKELEDLDDLDV